jgi:hypothetical protein
MTLVTIANNFGQELLKLINIHKFYSQSLEGLKGLASLEGQAKLTPMKRL